MKLGDALQILLPLASIFNKKKLNDVLGDVATVVSLTDSIKAVRSQIHAAAVNGQPLTLDVVAVSNLEQVFLVTDKLSTKIQSLRK